MTKQAPLQVALIGCGNNGRHPLQQLAEMKGVELAGVADPSTKARALAREAVQNPKLAGFRDYRKLLTETQPDAVVISTPHTLHHRQILDCLEAGCHVLCEKPLICSMQEARDVIAARDATGLILGISYQRHTMPPYIYCRQAIAQGDIGEVTFVSSWQAQAWWRITRGTWRVKPELSGGGQLNDSGSHLLDAALWMTQVQPKEVFAFVDKLDTEVDIVSSIAGQAAVAIENGRLYQDIENLFAGFIKGVAGLLTHRMETGWVAKMGAEIGQHGFKDLGVQCRGARVIYVNCAFNRHVYPYLYRPMWPRFASLAILA